MSTRPRDDGGSATSRYSRPLGIGTGIVILALVLLSVPPAIFLLPVVLVVMVVLYLTFARNKRKARAIARRRLGASGRTDTEVELSPGTSDALVLNDWGV